MGKRPTRNRPTTANARTATAAKSRQAATARAFQFVNVTDTMQEVAKEEPASPAAGVLSELPRHFDEDPVDEEVVSGPSGSSEAALVLSKPGRNSIATNALPIPQTIEILPSQSRMLFDHCKSQYRVPKKLARKLTLPVFQSQLLLLRRWLSSTLRTTGTDK